jgi:hypothetical protein
MKREIDPGISGSSDSLPRMKPTLSSLKGRRARNQL